MNVTGVDVLVYAFEEAAREVLEALPKLLLGALVLALAAALMKLGNKVVRLLVRATGVDRALQQYVPEMPVSIEAIAVALFDLGVLLVALAATVALVAPWAMREFTMAVYYTLRLASIAVVALAVFTLVESLAKRLRTEAKTRAFATLTTYLLLLLLVTDLVALSPEVKQAIGYGVALGLGLAIGSFSAWYFFHDYLEKNRDRRVSARSQWSSPGQPQSPSPPPREARSSSTSFISSSAFSLTLASLPAISRSLAQAAALSPTVGSFLAASTWSDRTRLTMSRAILPSSSSLSTPLLVIR